MSYPRMMVGSRNLEPSARRGIWRYTRQRKDWSIMNFPIEEAVVYAGSSRIPWVDAVVTAAYDEAGAEAARSYRVPIVNTLPFTSAGLPTVCVNNRAVAGLAFEHLRSLGLTRFGYLPWVKGPDNAERQHWFLRAAAEAGFEGERAVVIPNRLSTSDWHADLAAQAATFASLGKPIGIMVYADWLASMAIHALRAANIDVPNEIAVVGVGDDEITCEGLSPELSSVDCNFERVGFEAAALLARLVGGEPIPDAPMLVQPRGVIERASSQMLAVEDEDVEAALRFISRGFAGGKLVTAVDVASAVHVSRRSLDAKFVKAIGRTISDELGRRQTRAALDMLERTDASPGDVASRCGFKTVNHLSYVIRRATGLPPVSYRRSVQTPGKRH